MSRFIVGIDPGVNGGLCIISPSGASASPFKTAAGYLDILSVLRGEDVKAYVEELTGTVAGSPITPPSSFKLGRNVGIVEGLLMALEIPFETVRPKVWQQGLPGIASIKVYAQRKRALHNLAQQRFPQLKPTLKTCDAILIADYGRARNE